MQIDRYYPQLRWQPLHRLGAIFLAAMLILAGCDTLGSGDDDSDEDEPTLEEEIEEGLATFRQATARYHRLETAREDGFEQILPCLSNPDGDGAIGIPYARQDRFDETINLEEPEILFYEPQEDGPPVLVGGEPVVPIEVWTEDEPPSLFDREFHRNEEHGLFGLHMWVWRESPEGVFSFWNADVSCEFAEESAASAR